MYVCTQLERGLFWSTSTLKATVFTLRLPRPGSHNIWLFGHIETDCLDTKKHCTHWQEWAVLLMQLLCLTQVTPPEFPTKDNGEVKKKGGMYSHPGHLMLHSAYVSIKKWLNLHKKKRIPLCTNKKQIILRRACRRVQLYTSNKIMQYGHQENTKVLISIENSS